MASKISSLIIDSKEPEAVRLACRKYFKELDENISIPEADRLVSLPEGDYRLTMDNKDVLLIERKTVGDLMGSIADGRLFRQCTRMKEKTPWSYLVVVGSMTEAEDGYLMSYGQGRWNKTKWKYNSVQGALMTVQELGVNILHTTSLFPAIVRISNRSRGDVKIKPQRDVVVYGGGEVILASLPGVGGIKATEMINYFKSAAWALVYLTSPDWEDGEIKGIGPKTKAGIRKNLGLAENDRLIIDSGE